MRPFRVVVPCFLAWCLLGGGQTQAAPRPPEEERFAKADAQLNAVYAQLIKKLSPAAQTKLRQEERDWLAHDNQPNALLEDRTAATEARVEILQKQLEAIIHPALPVSGGDYTGHYQRLKNPGNYDFGLEVEQTGKKAHVSFGATKIDGSGAAPVGEGEGQIDAAGVLTFPFEDSFSNKGMGTLALKKTGYVLNMDATEVQEPRCLRLYGEITLRRKGPPRKDAGR